MKRVLFSILASLVTSTALASETKVTSLSCNAWNMLGFARMTLNTETDQIVSVINGGIMRETYKINSVNLEGGSITTILATIMMSDDYTFIFDVPLKPGLNEVVGGFYRKSIARPENLYRKISTVSCRVEIGQ